MKRNMLVIGALTLALAGCAAAPTPEPSPTPTVEPITAETTCTQYGNTTGTLLVNAWNQQQLGIITDAEREVAVADAWDKLRVIKVQPGSELEDRITALQEFTVDELPRDYHGSPEWAEAVAALQTSCTDAGAELAINIWNGG